MPALDASAASWSGEDVFLAFSPERVDPGNPIYHTKNTPKVVGGITPACTELATALYASCIDTIGAASSSPEAAELVKLLENTFRSVNIGLVNEMAIVCDKLGVDVWEVIDAAATKPFGFMKFTPGPGIGGHCIPLDPHYLAWKMRTLNYKTRFIDLAGEINSADAGVRRREGGARAQRRPQAGATAAASWCSASRTSATSTTCARARRSTSSACSRSMARGARSTIRSSRRFREDGHVHARRRAHRRSARGGGRGRHRHRSHARRLPAGDGQRVADRRHAATQRRDSSARKARIVSLASADAPMLAVRDRLAGSACVNIAVIGTGYVGLVAGACLAETGNDVDRRRRRRGEDRRLQRERAADLRAGARPTVERNQAAGGSTFTTDIAPRGRRRPKSSSSPSARRRTRTARPTCATCSPSPRRSAGSMTRETVVVTKSTVPVGTAAKVARGRRPQHARFPFDVVSNPEFLKEGAAIDDFMKPDRVVIGAETRSRAQRDGASCTRRSCAPGSRSSSWTSRRPS